MNTNGANDMRHLRALRDALQLLRAIPPAAFAQWRVRRDWHRPAPAPAPCTRRHPCATCKGFDQFDAVHL